MSDKLARMIGRLLPRGRAWNTSPSSTLYKLLRSLADEAVRVETRALDVLEEADPRTTTELITAWEGVLGLPGDCVDLAETLEDRRAAVVARLTAFQAQTKAYYVELASNLGYEITEDDITEPSTHVFALSLPESTVRYFRAGANYAGDRLTRFGDELIECVITQYKPAHTRVLFYYG